jgi:hypothetical protein
VGGALPQALFYTEYHDRCSATFNQLPVLDELDEEPTKEELSRAIDCLAIGKAPGEDGIPLEVIKTGKEELIEDLHELLCLCWRKGSVQRDMQGAKIVTLYKNKGDQATATVIGAFYC